MLFKNGKVKEEKTSIIKTVIEKTVKTIDFSVSKSFLSESHLRSAADRLNDKIVVSNSDVVSMMPMTPNSLILKTVV